MSYMIIPCALLDKSCYPSKPKVIRLEFCRGKNVGKDNAHTDKRLRSGIEKWKKKSIQLFVYQRHSIVLADSDMSHIKKINIRTLRDSFH